ncbi:thermonuclease family protein [Rubrobacter indicoceani]|uniref:thermonuclease family protein n=1 Tax=Rubrobacter indicoceani TaxID=2051957 RepID=UPI0013C508C3|nr:thermonuclease family protein [Rubrobacter indicoceani]
MKHFIPVLFLLLAAAGCASAGGGLNQLLDEGTTAADNSTAATVTRVTDGDTVEISSGIDGVEDVRLIGIDTPEPYASGSPEPLSAEASEFARETLDGERVRLEFDRETTDDYGRLLAYVYVGDEMFNERAVREGYAQVATFPPNTRYVERFEAAQEEARGGGRGIWGLPEDEACLLRDRGNGLGGGC